MTLIKSISGIRGTIGGLAGDGLTPPDIIKYTAAFGQWVLSTSNINKIVIGRDARLSGDLVRNLVAGTLQSMGINVVDLGLSTTPTVEMAVTAEMAGGGIILTASHNPKQWNALKLLNAKGEFINEIDGLVVLSLAESGKITYAEIDQIGKVTYNDTYINKHIQHILNLPLVDVKAIAAADFKIVVDAVNSTGGFAVPQLLEALGVKTVYKVNCGPDGHFAHDPEPLPANLKELSVAVSVNNADMGIAVDPDVDRLCFVCEDGTMFGEEYTLVAVADYVLKHTPGNTVSNLSSTRALRDVTENACMVYSASAVGEVNVVNKMKETHAVIGGEGNGGIIYPELHYGRDALVGIALFLTHLAHQKISMSALKNSYPAYFIAKNKLQLDDSLDIDGLLLALQERYLHEQHSTIDGLKIEFGKTWVHLRRSNTEPVIRIYAEARQEAEAHALASKMISELQEMMEKVQG